MVEATQIEHDGQKLPRGTVEIEGLFLQCHSRSCSMRDISWGRRVLKGLARRTLCVPVGLKRPATVASVGIGCAIVFTGFCDCVASSAGIAFDGTFPPEEPEKSERCGA